MRGYILTISISIFLVLFFVLGWFLERHLLFFQPPLVGGKFELTWRCDKNIEALSIATQALPYLTKKQNFGLQIAFETLTNSKCLQDGLPLAETYVEVVQNWASLEFSQLPDGPWYPERMQRSGLVMPEIEPIGSLAILRSLIASYNVLNSGNGLIYYVRCDYLFGKEPFQTFFSSNMHLTGSISDRYHERLSECSAEPLLRRRIEAALEKSEILPAIYQE